jgi:hypothetical protein
MCEPGANPPYTGQFANDLNRAVQAKSGGDMAAKGWHIKTKQRCLFPCQDHVRTLRWSIAANGGISAVQFYDLAWAALFMPQPTWPGSDNSVLSQNPAMFQKASHLIAKRFSKVLTRSTETGRSLKPRPPAFQHRYALWP